MKRLKRTNKPTFNPKLLKESKEKRDVLAEHLQKIEDEFGKFMVKYNEPKKVDTTWDYIMKEMSEAAEYFQQRRKFRIFKAKKLASGCFMARKSKKNTEQHRIKVIKRRKGSFIVVGRGIKDHQDSRYYEQIGTEGVLEECDEA